MLLQVRYNAPPGRILAIGCLAGPLAKIVLELLRDHSRPPGLMLGIPAIAVVGATIAVSRNWWRTLHGLRRPKIGDGKAP
jgi:hypothetical protein